MKRMLILAVVVLFASQVKAQDKRLTPDLKQDIVKLIEFQNQSVTESLIEPALKRVSGEAKSQMKQDIDAVLDEYYTDVSKIYLEYYSEEEIRAIVDFYESDIGQKIKKVQPKISEETMQMSQGLMRKLDPVIRKYLKRK